jgi:hypothetical protein
MIAKYKLAPADRRVHPLRDSYINVYRVIALIDIPRHGVKAGEVGGYVDHKKVLSQKGDCWIGGEAKVYVQFSEKKKATVFDNAFVTDEAVVYGQGNTEIRIFDDAFVGSKARVLGAAVGGIFRIHGGARLLGNAVATNPMEITGHLSEHASVTKGSVLGDAHVSNHAKIDGSTVLD